MIKTGFSLAVLVGWLLFCNQARAEYLSSRAESPTDAGTWQLFDAVGAGASCSHSCEADDLNELRQFFTIDLNGLHPQDTLGSAGTPESGSSVKAPSGQQVFLFARPEAPHALVVGMLLHQNSIQEPAPFLSSIFHPPRTAA